MQCKVIVSLFLGQMKPPGVHVAYFYVTSWGVGSGLVGSMDYFSDGFIISFRKD